MTILSLNVSNLTNIMLTLDIKRNRSERKYSRTEIIKRILWTPGKLFFRLTPRTAFGLRNFILQIYGAKIGEKVHIYNSVHIYFPWNLEIGDYSSIGEYGFIYNLGKITIGESVTISQRAHLCAGTHDYRYSHMPLLKPAIEIKDKAWICADAYVGPGCNVGEGSIVGARAVVSKNVNNWDIVAGNPAKFIKKREIID